MRENRIIAREDMIYLWPFLYCCCYDFMYLLFKGLKTTKSCENLRLATMNNPYLVSHKTKLNLFQSFRFNLFRSDQNAKN